MLCLLEMPLLALSFNVSLNQKTPTYSEGLICYEPKLWHDLLCKVGPTVNGNLPAKCIVTTTTVACNHCTTVETI